MDRLTPQSMAASPFQSLEDMFSLRGQTVLITGAARGLGWQLALSAMAAGAHVVLNDVNAEGLAQRLGEIVDQGLDGSIEAFDVTDSKAVAAAVASIIARRGRVDVLVNNAGTQLRKAFLEYSPEEWDYVFNAHVRGSFLVTQSVVPHMLKQGAGRVVVIGSIVAQATRGTLAPYASAKGALTSMIRELAQEYGARGLTFNAIAPGFLATDFTQALVEDKDFSAFVTQRVPAGRWGTLQDIGPALVYLASRAGAFVNGSVLTIDGGLLAAI